MRVSCCLFCTSASCDWCNVALIWTKVCYCKWPNNSINLTLTNLCCMFCEVLVLITHDRWFTHRWLIKVTICQNTANIACRVEQNKSPFLENRSPIPLNCVVYLIWVFLLWCSYSNWCDCWFLCAFLLKCSCIFIIEKHNFSILICNILMYPSTFRKCFSNFI